MKFDSGHTHLFPILSFVAEHPVLPAGNMNHMTSYRKLVNDMIADIPDDLPGWYLWGRFTDTGFWQTLYLGKAGNQKTSSLQARIKEELLDERPLFWAYVFGRETANKQHSKLYDGRYDSLNPRHLRKTGSHFIAWVSADPCDEEEIKIEERILIALYRPIANIQRIKYPDKTPHTDKVIRKIDKEIERIKAV